MKFKDGKMEIDVQTVDYHRNGVSGVGFHVVLFTWREDFEVEDRTMMATVFPEEVCPDPCIAVVDFNSLGEHWRGDHFVTVLRRAVKAFSEDSHNELMASLEKRTVKKAK